MCIISCVHVGEREARPSSREFKAIYKEMRVVESTLFEEGEVLIQSRVRKVLELIGVRNLYPMDIIKHHILPQFTTGTWKVHSYILPISRPFEHVWISA
jgi:hypothetical protein